MTRAEDRRSPMNSQSLLGPTGISVSELCVGTSPIGGTPALYGYDVEAEIAVATVESVIREPSITFLDTSNNYGAGRSERRIGEAIRRAGGLPEGFIVATKGWPRAWRSGLHRGPRFRVVCREPGSAR